MCAILVSEEKKGGNKVDKAVERGRKEKA